MTESRKVEAACLYAPGGAPTPGDLAAVHEFGRYLTARSTVTREDVLALAKAQHKLVVTGLAPADGPAEAGSAVPEWDRLETRDRAAALVKARTWLLAAHVARLVGGDPEGRVG